MALTLLMMLTAMTLVPLGDTAGKLLVQLGVAPVFVGWSRFAIGAVMFLPFMGRGFDFRLYLDWRVWLRAAFIAGGVACILTALKDEPLANVFGAFFVGPIIAYFVSAWLLGEKLSTGRTALLLLGFIGVLLVVRPGFGMTTGLAFAVLAGIFYGLFLVSSRWLSQVAGPRKLFLSQLVLAALLLAPIGAGQMPDLTPRISGLLALSAAGSLLGNLLLLLAFRRAEAGVLAPFVYFQLLAATGFGWIIFGDVPDAVTLAGLVILLCSGFATLALRRTVA